MITAVRKFSIDMMSNVLNMLLVLGLISLPILAAM